MHLIDIIHRTSPPEPWSEGDKIPWHETAFSERMLREHLTQAHNAASRRFEIIDQHVAWIHEQWLGAEPGRVLDLGCGPGLYACRLARLGHTCTGIDFSPASIAYAREQAGAESLTCAYILQDIRTAEYGADYDLAMLIFGEFNVFRPQEAAAILQKAQRALKAGGRLLLEPHPYDLVKTIGQFPPNWYSSESGLFSPSPHLSLNEHFWDEDQQTATTRHFIIDAETGETARHVETMQAYTNEQYRHLLVSCGFENIQFHPSLTGETDENQPDLFVIAAQRPKT